MESNSSQTQEFKFSANTNRTNLLGRHKHKQEAWYIFKFGSNKAKGTPEEPKLYSSAHTFVSRKAQVENKRIVCKACHEM